MHYEERINPENAESVNFKRHFVRYQFASSYVRGQSVLDAGCGTGYGSCSLAELAQNVVGVDVAPEAIEYSKAHYRRPNLRFLLMDCEALAFPASSFDVVCGFEVIEHLRHSGKYLDEIRRILKRGGLAILSTPNKMLSSPHAAPSNPHHVQEFDYRTFAAMLAERFSGVRIYGQRDSRSAQEAQRGTPAKRRLARMDPFGFRRLIPSGLYAKACRWAGFPLEQDLSLADFSIREERAEESEYFVAVCTRD